ncbi:MAG: hypothetical protein KY444_11940 [Gemmatimonadetes bacterium]|nr:hypothetical protein [Gemmatimonadota bacterium]
MNSITGARSPLRGAAAGLLLALGLNGCFTYAPVNGAMPGPGARVKVALENPQEVRTGDLTANDVVEVTGELISADTTALVVSAFQLTSRSGYEHLALGETTHVPRLNVSAVRVNRINPLRTAAMTGLALLGGALFVSQISPPRGGGGPGNEGPGQQ